MPTHWHPFVLIAGLLIAAVVTASPAAHGQGQSPSGDVTVQLKVTGGLTWEGTIKRSAGPHNACVAGKPDSPQMVAELEKQVRQGGIQAEIAKSMLDDLKTAPAMYTVSAGATSLLQHPSKVDAFSLTIDNYRATVSRYDVAFVTVALTGQPWPIAMSMPVSIDPDGRSGRFMVAGVKPHQWDGPPLDVEGSWSCASLVSRGGSK